MSEKIVKYTDDNLFTVVDITHCDRNGNEVTYKGYVDLDGRVWFDEHMARWCSCSHKVCECGEIYEKNSWCKKCHSKKETERFLKFPTVEWDGHSPIFIKDCEEVFTDLGDIEDYCEDNGIKIEDLELCSAEIMYAHELDPSDIYQDALYEGEVPAELEEIFDELNMKLREKKIILSYWQQDERVIIKSETMEQNKHCNSDNLTEIEQEILEYEAETEAWRREVRQRVEQEKEQEKNALINIGIVFLGVLLLFGGVAITVGKKDPVVRHMGYAPWYCLAGVTYAFMPASSNISSSLIKDIQLMEEAYKRQEAKSGN